MRTVLVDTSSLIALALASGDGSSPKANTAAFHARYPDLDGAIEALVFYDQMIFDRPSIERNLRRLPALESIVTLGSVTPAEADEERVYSAVETEYVNHLNDLDGLKTASDALASRELGVSRDGPSFMWRHVKDELRGKAAGVASEIGRRLEGHQAYDQLCALVLRLFYYDVLQQIIGADLVLHPSKASLRETEKGTPGTIIDNFDESVRAAFYARKQRWLGHSDVRIRVPMLTEFVLRRCPTASDLLNVVTDVHQMKEAQQFRRAVTQLLDVAQSGNEDIDDITAFLEATCADWQATLATGKLTKELSVSVPMVGISAKFSLPDIKLNRSTTDHILAFVHLLLLDS